MYLFDLHSDTPFRMYRENLQITDKRLDCSLPGLAEYEKSAAVYAVWSDHKNSGQRNYEDFFKITANLKSNIDRNSTECSICTYSEDIACDDGKTKIILAVEGGGLLCSDLSRLQSLYKNGVRVLTPLWRGEDFIGGAHDTQKGLTGFGKELVRECGRLGIITDVSHMSVQSFSDTLSAAEGAVMASHSNSFSVCAHPRNITDEQFCAIAKRHGIVGINLYPPFVLPQDTPSAELLFDGLCSHILHFLSLGGEKCICMGGDRDGIPCIPGYSPVEFAVCIAERLLKLGIKQNIINDIFYGNALRFFASALPTKGNKIK